MRHFVWRISEDLKAYWAVTYNHIVVYLIWQISRSEAPNGTEFVNTILNYLIHTVKDDHRLTTPYHPQANDFAERLIRKVKDLEKLLIRKNHSGTIILPMFQL